VVGISREGFGGTRVNQSHQASLVLSVPVLYFFKTVLKYLTANPAVKQDE
jgi:hypothetical protein